MGKAMNRALALALALMLPADAAAQSVLDGDVAARIRREATDRSQIMRTLEVLTDLYGPRVTGSPSLQAAGEWAVKTMESWGLTNGRLEPWDFGRPGWANERLSAHLLAPVKDHLVAEAVAWTPGTEGAVRGFAFQLTPPENATAAQVTAYLNTVKDQVRGRIVLAGRSVQVPVDLEPPVTRCADADLRTFYGQNPVAQRADAGGCRGTPRATTALDVQASRAIDEFLVGNGALVRINDAGLPHGIIAAFQNRTYDVARAVPTVVMRNEDYGRISRLIANGLPVELEFDIVNRLYPEGRTAYNAIAEIEGADKSDEVVMIGGHLDSWQSATGATDNAIGCAAVMEAARILRAIGVRPRRTIRVALWSGEEEDLLGSRAYVRQHFGTFETQQPGYSKLVAYLNMDNGTGRLRGAIVFGPQSAAAVLREMMSPFADLGMVGVASTRDRDLGGTDSTSFNNAGLPGVNFRQDPIEYDSHTHHSSLDTYERVIEQDAKSAAIVIAATAYQLAMREAPLPRFGAQDMPAPRRR
jgi:hypothetical protein